jgi:hypothetical protein
MDLRPELQIKTAIKAMTDVVLPAVDPHNKLAQEQSRLIIGMLGLALRHLPLMYRYEQDELSRFLALADQLRKEAAGNAAIAGEGDALAASIARAADVLERARAEPSELTAANLALRQSIGALVSALGRDADPVRFKRVSAAVTQHAQGQLLRERSMLLGQGWEGDPKSIAPIEELIGGAGSGPSA